ADAPAGRCRFCCGECGWAFAEPAALERHKRLHQESREKIIEEIQKLNEFPDEGREARLQCPKCVFGTNSSKIFVQHAKMHVKERKEHASRSAGLFGELRDGHGLYKPFQAEELPAAAPAAGKAPSACVLCGFPAPNEHILKEHLRYAHSHFSWQPEPFQDDPNQPGTSRDSYSPARPAVEFFGKAERLFPAAAARESASHHEPPALAPGHHPRLDKSNGPARKEPRASQLARKAAPYAAPHHGPGFAGGFPSPRGYSPQQLRKRAAPRQLEGDGDDLRGHPAALREWPAAGEEEEEEDEDEEEEEEEEMELGAAVTVPQAALDLKRAFGATLRATEAAVATEEQRHQLRMMVPV
ncbi:WIZ protein, partial [Panurus biarmicus]|nr:WIZ protein [Panurus biarmicus]